MKRLTDRPPDFEQFLKVLRRSGRPDHLPFYEHFASPGFIARRLGVEVEALTWDNPEYPRLYVDFWMSMGYDCVPMEIPFNVPETPIETAGGGYESESTAVIFSFEDFERYPWPDASAPIDFDRFEQVARVMPEGAGVVGGVEGGPFEWAAKLMGYQGLSLAQMIDPDLFRAVFQKIGELHVGAMRHLAEMECVGVLRQGDDLGFKTSTFLSPETLREHVLPIYKRMVDHAHAAGKPFILHSCGNLECIYDDLIDYCGIDAKHSFENAIMPVTEFKKRYGDRVTAIGGVDVDFICRADPEDIRAHTRRMIEECFDDGCWALGTGNSLTNYMPVDHYLAVLETGLEYSGASV